MPDKCMAAWADGGACRCSCPRSRPPSSRLLDGWVQVPAPRESICSQSELPMRSLCAEADRKPIVCVGRLSPAHVLGVWPEPEVGEDRLVVVVLRDRGRHRWRARLGVWIDLISSELRAKHQEPEVEALGCRPSMESSAVASRSNSWQPRACRRVRNRCLSRRRQLSLIMLVSPACWSR